ncbi:FadR/GntR family transcriptional regulator [Pararhizobium haloflavum]|uniref:FadR/GntR family transcriptional regulator n=1 Tax=Pararhizobium haloflavum TaxID=2037914 RepID=UPI000C19E528|nr:FCD domain-containing protein [Pararhizobium haloflavum]
MGDQEGVDNSSIALERLRALVNRAFSGREGRLPTERALADQFGISRRSVRRALEVLEAEGRVWRKQGSGTYAGPRPEPVATEIGRIAADTDFMEVMEARLRIEPQLAQLAALRAKPAAVDRMRDINQRLRESGDSDERELWDSALHRQIARSAGNRVLLTLFDIVDSVRQNQAWQTIRARARSDAAMRAYVDQHEAIVEAIGKRDPVAAGIGMREHLMTLNDNLIRQTSLESLSDAS